MVPTFELKRLGNKKGSKEKTRDPRIPSEENMSTGSLRFYFKHLNRLFSG